MAANQRIVRQLKREANNLKSELVNVLTAIRALHGRGTYRDISGIGIDANRPARRKLSREARERIAKAQRTRWAKARAAQRKKPLARAA